MRQRGAAIKLGMVALFGLTALSPRMPTAEIAYALTGTFDNQAQYDTADLALKMPPSVSGACLDRQRAVIKRVSAPQIGRTVLYLEWRGGGPDGPISRQRIWALDEAPGGAATMRFYTIKQPAALVGGNDKIAFARLGPADLVGYPDSCAVRFQPTAADWRGRIDPKDCRIVAQSGRGMRLDVTITARHDGFDYQEAGILDDGKRAFAVPPTMPYRFARLPPST